MIISTLTITYRVPTINVTHENIIKRAHYTHCIEFVFGYHELRFMSAILNKFNDLRKTYVLLYLIPSFVLN